MEQRNTVQRSLVLDAVRNLHSHATVEEIYNEVRKSHPNVSRGTVYRNLNKLAEQGEIGRVEMAGESDRFDHISQKHYHVRCTVCRRIFDVEMEYMNGLESKIRDKHGFDFSGHEILFRGICPDCKANGKKTGGKPEKKGD